MFGLFKKKKKPEFEIKEVDVGEVTLTLKFRDSSVPPRDITLIGNRIITVEELVEDTVRDELHHRPSRVEWAGNRAVLTSVEEIIKGERKPHIVKHRVLADTVDE